MNQTSTSNLQKTLRNATLLCFWLSASCAWAIEAGGIRFDDKISVGDKELLANGAGVRSKFIFDVYAMALYLPARANTAETIMAQSGPRRIAIQLLRDVSAEDFVGALRSGLQANHSEEEFSALKPQTQQFSDTLVAVKKVKKGTPVLIDFLPGTGTRITISGQTQGKDIAGESFYNALLKIWLGNKPVQDDLKGKLLGR